MNEYFKDLIVPSANLPSAHGRKKLHSLKKFIIYEADGTIKFLKKNNSTTFLYFKKSKSKNISAKLF